jgi:hypothetical protein
VWQAIIQVAGNSDPRADEARKRLRALKPL